MANNKLYVGNLNYDTTETRLTEVFGGAGEVQSVNIITDRYSGRPKGFGFVEMADSAQAQEAINQLNGTEVDGRTIKVDFARPRRDDRRGGFGARDDRRGSFGSRDDRRW
jgi:RNA recognition motif-containing protein